MTIPRRAQEPVTPTTAGNPFKLLSSWTIHEDGRVTRAGALPGQTWRLCATCGARFRGSYGAKLCILHRQEAMRRPNPARSIKRCGMCGEQGHNSQTCEARA